MILSTHGIVSSISGIDADWLAYYNRVIAAGGSLSTTEQNATKTLVADLKAAGIWSAMRAVYPMVGASAAACAQNLKSSSFTGTFSSGWTFASTGVTPNGTSAYFDSNLNENSTMTLNNIHLGHYSRTNNTSAVCDIGLLDTSITIGTHTITYSSGNAAVRNTDISSGFTATPSTAGMFINSRSNSIETKYFYNSSLFNTITSASVQKSNLNYFVGARNNSNTAVLFSNRQYAFASIGDGLTDTQASDFYTAVQAFQTTLSRQV
jgi:hypothetical protein